MLRYEVWSIFTEKSEDVEDNGSYGTDYPYSIIKEYRGPLVMKGEES